jgi:hypothetical protein
MKKITTLAVCAVFALGSITFAQTEKQAPAKKEEAKKEAPAKKDAAKKETKKEAPAKKKDAKKEKN